MVAAEPGRLLSGPCQLILLTVQDIIQRKNRKDVIFCDAGAMSLSPMLLTEQHAVLSLFAKRRETKNYEVLGMLPSALDRVAASAELPEMSIGDRIAVLDTGAYFLPMNNHFSGPLPPVAWIENGAVDLVRKAEQMKELYSRDFN